MDAASLFDAENDWLAAGITERSSSRMQSNWKALEYIYRVTAGRHRGTIQKERTMNGRPVIEIQPAGGAAKRSVVCVHGMSVRGYHDPRIIQVGQSLAAMGYRAVIPSYPEIQKLRIDPASSDRIAADMAATAEESGYPVGLFTASFSGGLSLIAAARPSVADLVSAMLVVGSYAHVDSTLNFFLHREKVDPYGLFIILNNFLPFLNEPEALLRAFYIAACDDGFQRKEPELPSYLNSQPDWVRQRFHQYIDDRSFRLEQWQKIHKIPEALHIFQQMDVLRVASGLKAAICLLHGANDIVIPPEESILLQKTLKDQVPLSLTITSIIDHGNVRANLSMAAEMLSLLRTIALFFRSLDGAAPIGE